MGLSFHHRVHVIYTHSNYNTSQKLSRLDYLRSSFCGQDEVTPFGKNGDKGQHRAAAQCVVMEELVCACFMKSSGDEARSDHTFNHTPVSPRSSELTAQTRCRVVRREQTLAAAELSRHHVSPELTANDFSTTSCAVTKINVVLDL